jgi:hypothetical protein
MPGPTNETIPDAEPIEQTTAGELEYEIVPPPAEAVPEITGGESVVRYDNDGDNPLTVIQRVGSITWAIVLVVVVVEVEDVVLVLSAAKTINFCVAEALRYMPSLAIDAVM